MKRYEHRTPAPKRTLLKAIINNPASKKPGELEKNLMTVVKYVKKYEVMAGTDLPEDMKVTVIIDLCTKDLKEHLELSTQEMTYKQVRDEIISDAERKRNAFSSDLMAMDVDDVADDHMWWGGMNHHQEQLDQHFSEELHSRSWTNSVGKGGFKGWNKGGYQRYPKGGSKGSFSDFKGVGKSDFNKGVFNGAAKEKAARVAASMGIATGAGWGHSQSCCRQKDEFMEN